MSEVVKKLNAIQLSLNHPGNPQGNAAEVAAWVGAKAFGVDGDLTFITIFDPVLSYRVTDLETYASMCTDNIVKDGQWVELWKDQDAEQLEQRIQDQNIDAPRVTYEHIEKMMKRVQYVTVQQPGDTTSTFVHAYLDGQFFLATGFSGCVDPARFNPATKAAEDELWKLEGYALYKNLQAIEQSNPKYSTGEVILAENI